MWHNAKSDLKKIWKICSLCSPLLTPHITGGFVVPGLETVKVSVRHCDLQGERGGALDKSHLSMHTCTRRSEWPMLLFKRAQLKDGSQKATSHSDILSAWKETVKTKHILLKIMTSWLFWWKNFKISTRVQEVFLCPVFSNVIFLQKVASLGFADVPSRDMSAEACKNSASRSALQAPH